MTKRQKLMLQRIISGGALFVLGLLLDGILGTIALLAAWLVAGFDVILEAIHKIGKKNFFDESFLMTIASFCAVLLGELTEAAAVMLFFQVGELFQNIAVERSRKSVASLMDLRPDVAYIMRDCQIIYTSNHKLWEGIADYCAEEKLGVQLHLACTEAEVEESLDRTGLSPAELLSCHRLLNVPVTAAGCACLCEEDKAVLGKKKATAVVTPCANAKAGQKLAPIAAAVKAGINVALGTDGAIEAGNLDMFEVMRHAAYGERVAGGDASKLPAPAVLMMATVCGARAQGRAQETGMLKVGMDADLILVDFTAPHLMPCHNVLSSLVFSAKGGDVAMTMVRGQILYQSGRFPTIDLPEVVEEITGYAIPRLLSDSDK